MLKNPKLRQKRQFDSIYLLAGDTLISEVYGCNGDKYILREEIGRAIEINTIITFDLDNGIGGAFTLEEVN